MQAGLGKSLLPCAVAERELGLRQLGDAPPVLSRDLWLLVHADLRRLERVTAVIAWIEGGRCGRPRQLEQLGGDLV